MSKVVTIAAGKWLRTLAIVSIMPWLANCSGSPDSRLTISNTSATPEAVCQRVLDALALGDEQELKHMVLTRFEHDSILVPQMPIGKDTTGGEKGLGLAWFLLEQRSDKGIRRALVDHGGKSYELVSVNFNRPQERHGDLILHKGTEVTVRTPEGEEATLGIFGSIIEQNGRYKLVSIRD